MRIQRTHKLGLMFIMILFLCSILAACAPTMKDTTVAGFGSNISVKLPGELKKDDTQLPVDPTMKKFMKGQQLYQVEDSSISVIILTLSIDTQAYSGISGKDLAVSMRGPVMSYAKAVLSSLKAKNIKEKDEDITISGKPATVKTATFDAEDKKMGMKIIAFQDDDAYWVLVPIYKADDQDAVKAADELVKSIQIKK